MKPAPRTNTALRADPATAPTLYGNALGGFLNRRRKVLCAFEASYDLSEIVLPGAMRDSLRARATRLAGVVQGTIQAHRGQL